MRKNGRTDRDSVGMLSEVGPGYHVLDGSADAPNRKGHCCGLSGRFKSIVKHMILENWIKG